LFTDRRQLFVSTFLLKIESLTGIAPVAPYAM
jgi:hypothetical protein